MDKEVSIDQYFWEKKENNIIEWKALIKDALYESDASGWVEKVTLSWSFE
jgi:hypothetical protein